MADPRAPTVTPTDADVVAHAALRAIVDRIGADRAAIAALHVRSDVHAAALLMTARGDDVAVFMRLLRLEPGELAATVDWATVPAPPLPADERTMIPDEINLPTVAGGYRGRQRLAMDLPEATRLAALVSGQAGVILYMAARGDTRHDTAEVLKISVDDVDAVLDHAAGQHVSRPDG